MEDVGRENECVPVRAERWCRDLAVGLSGPLLPGPLERRNKATRLTIPSLAHFKDKVQ